MGCTESREMVEVEERTLVKLEEQLKFTNNSCLLTDLCFRKYSHDGQINENQWEELAYFLCLSPKNSRSRPKIESFFSAYKEQSHYHFHSLLLAAIMLSDGYPRHKARLIFELYDDDNKEHLDERDLIRIISDLIDLSLYKIPILLGENDTGVEKYIHGLKAYEEEAKAMFLEKFKRARTLTSFVRVFRTWNVFCPSDLRKKIENIKQSNTNSKKSQIIEENGNQC